jgi:hypothetical protein
MRRQITDPNEVRLLTAALLEGLQLYAKENESMFRKKQRAKPQSIGDVRKAAAAAIEKAIFEARGVLPVRDIINILTANLQTLNYLDAVGATISTSGNVSRPPSRSTKEQIGTPFPFSTSRKSQCPTKQCFFTVAVMAMPAAARRHPAIRCRSNCRARLLPADTSATRPSMSTTSSPKSGRALHLRNNQESNNGLFIHHRVRSTRHYG